MVMLRRSIASARSIGCSIPKSAALPQRAATRSVPSSSVAAALIAPPKRSVAASFSTSVARCGSGTSDVELASRLQQEISYEKETANSQTHSEVASGQGAEPDFLRDFKSMGIWSINDVNGSDEISLEREFGNEKIRVLFSIGDIDAGMEEEFESEEGGQGEDNEPALPVRVAVTIAKPNNGGALTIDAQSESGQFSIENISFYKDAKMASELTAEADWKRRGLYIGPQFPTLDDGLQEQFQAFLDERGINDDLAMFIPMFAEYKEQKEYCAWLENVHKWIQA